MKCDVGAGEGMDFELCPDRDGSGEGEKLGGISTREVRDATKAAFTPEEVVVELGDAVEMDGVDGDGPAWPYRLESRDHDGARGGKRDGRIEPGGRGLVVAACPGGTEGASAGLFAFGTGGDENFAAPVKGNLNGERGGSTKPEEAEAATGRDARDVQGAIADHTTTEERRSREVLEGVRETEREVCINREVLGEATIAMPASECGRFAEILQPGGAEFTGPAGGAQPGDAGTVAGSPATDATAKSYHTAHGLVTGNERQPSRTNIALRELQVGAADATGADLEQEFTGTRLRRGEVLDAERRRRHRAWSVEASDAHRSESTRPPKA